ncbi:BTB domain-containing protein [Mycena venus]|uniref:BTB domain-containing protein n=1 Tax=Mycena venus TaxID=2733690 RepID=A0A8H6YQS4_9AGAR|nr:BTB domain-containing protein [Mycena venus]
MSSPPVKRQRTENTPITHSDVWYKDGSVVLQADTQQFRVHWSVLCQHSSFFRNLEDLPQPPDQPLVDGCPIVEIQDAAVDIEHLLKALYNPALFNEKAIPFAYISSFIRIGRKYEFKDLFNIAVERLAFENPTTLEEYVTLSDIVKAAGNPDPSFVHTTTRIVHYPGIHYDMLALARENNLLEVLPCAYYRIARMSMVTLFQEIQRPDGTVCALSSLDRTTCTLGHERILQAQWKPGNSLGWLMRWIPAADCTDVSSCQRNRESLLNKIVLSAEVHSFITVSYIKALFCTACGDLVKAAVTAGRAKMWEDLPSYFDLPPWSELKSSTEL